MAFGVLIPGVVSGWAAWQVLFAPIEQFLAQSLGGAVTALTMWAILGIFMVAGYLLAFKIGTRFITKNSSGNSAPVIDCQAFQ